MCRGHQLEITCTVTGSFLEWGFYLIHEGETTARRRTLIVTSLSPNNQTQTLQVNSTMFTFLRTSAANSMPLVSTLNINATTEAINGTVITCSDVEA